MKSKIFYSLAIIVVFFGVLFANNTAKADCPTNIPPTDIPWIQMGPDTLFFDMGNGDTCKYAVWYCYRQYSDDISPAPFIEVFADGAVLIGPCNGSNLTTFEFRKLINYEIIRLNPDNLNWPCPTCPDFIDNYSTWQYSCYDANDNPCGASQFCRFTYRVCCDENGDRKVVEIGSNSIGGDCPSGCSSGCNNGE